MHAHNKLTLPGFVCAHTHLYSALARGMPAPAQAPRNFVEILERVWWRLDRALDAEAVSLSALIGAIEAAKAGCTTLIDHHASPGRNGGAVEGSLDLVAGAIAEVGLRGVVCYEVTDRNGADEARAGVRENDRFLARVRHEPPRLLRAMVGAHAAFTLSNETAEAIADVARRHRAGVHIHVAEDAVDRHKEGESTVAWLQARGLVDERSLLVHCVHVDEADVARIRDAGAWVVHNPRSNANNAVGYARPSRFGDRLLLGTDGIGADMRAEALNVWPAPREHGDPLDVLPVGTRVAVTGVERDGFAQVVIDRQVRWVNADYLRDHLPKPSPTEAPSTTTPSTDASATPTPSPTGGILSSAPCASGSSVESGLVANAVALHRAVCAHFPQVTEYGGYRPDGEHADGHAIDVMVYSDSATGQAVADWLHAKPSTLGLSDIIWAQHIWTLQRSSEGWRPMEDRGSTTANHYDHVHVRVL